MTVTSIRDARHGKHIRQQKVLDTQRQRPGPELKSVAVKVTQANRPPVFSRWPVLLCNSAEKPIYLRGLFIRKIEILRRLEWMEG